MRIRYYTIIYGPKQRCKLLFSAQILPWQLNQQSPESIKRSTPPDYMEAHRLKQMKAILEASNGLNHNFLNNQLAE